MVGAYGGSVPSCLFCRIIDGEEHAHVVWDGPDTVAFLDVRPLFPGHTLIVPRRHIETLPDVDDDALTPLFRRARAVATAMEAELQAAGSFVAMNNRISQSVPHLHVHVVPRNRKDGLRGFFWPRTTYASADEADGIADRLRRWLEAHEPTDG
jgi:histidine triad (HIT) family protein